MFELSKGSSSMSCRVTPALSIRSLEGLGSFCINQRIVNCTVFNICTLTNRGTPAGNPFRF
ncbi:unnamed protein product [Haemonchus placei]|uniref:Uncharacterized protein n=1 Tax=Haemonchus placei TaxID=6290 RepID=A0A0N4VUK9_HAEPC|nr:unnamed protein product [Haemonchus placei]